MNTIAKALNILGLFTENNSGLSLSDIAQSLGLNESTTSHIVSTLVSNGFLFQPTKRGKYYLGIKVIDIAGAIKKGQGGKTIISYLVELSQLSNESICLEVWQNNKLPQSGTIYYTTGQNYNEWAIRRLYSTCVGKIVLANLNKEELKKYLPHKFLKALLPRDLNIKQFKSELADIKREGFAYEDEEGGVGIRGVAARITNNEKEVTGSVFVVGNANRLSRTKLNDMAPTIKACAFKISNLLVNRNPDIENVGYNQAKPSSNLLPYQKKETINSITKAVNVLGLLSEKRGGLDLGDIAQSLGLKEPTTSHIVSTLVKNGFLYQQAKRGKYQLGVRILDIAGAIRSDYGNRSIISCLFELSRLLNESICLEVWYGNKLPLTGTDYYSNKQDYDDWAIRRLNYTCVGKIILANLRSEELKKYFRYKYLKKLTPSVRAEIDQFRAELAGIQREGIAYEDEEGSVGIRGVAAGILNSEKEVIGSIFVVGHADQMSSMRLKEMAPMVKACASKITELMIAGNSLN